jgi:hypothetical protein
MSDYYSKYLEMVSSEKKNYAGAGFIFYQTTGYDFDILLGLDNKPDNKTLSVFGGGREKKDTSPLYTAVREVFEELFNIVPNGLDIFVKELQKKIDDHTIVEKMFMKKNNEICYFTNINLIYTFIDHLIHHECPWTFKGNHTWNEYKNNISKFIGDRVLKNNQKVKNGLNEIQKIFLINIKDINQVINNFESDKKGIIINKKEYFFRDNLNRYLQEKIITDIINKII